MNLPNILTVGRLFLIIPILALFMLEEIWPAAVWINLGLYILAAFSDYLDGYLARRLNQKSEFGVFMDPISDKIFVGAILVALVAFGRLSDLWILPVIIILSREFLVSGIREYLGPKGIKVPVTPLAKWKTATQMFSLAFLIAGPYAPHILLSGQILLCVAALLTVITGWDYMRAGLKHMTKTKV